MKLRYKILTGLAVVIAAAFVGLVLTLSTISKLILYSLLFLAAIYWGFEGDFVDFWDAFLWLVAFVFIELNVFEWHQEELEEAGSGGAGP